jgi:hypothetical protein
VICSPSTTGCITRGTRGTRGGRAWPDTEKAGAPVRVGAGRWPSVRRRRRRPPGRPGGCTGWCRTSWRR